MRTREKLMRKNSK